MTQTRHIRRTSDENLKKRLKELGFPSYAFGQIKKWLWKENIEQFGQMNNLSKERRHLLSEHFDLTQIKINNSVKSLDGTIKYTFRLYDGFLIEGVLIPDKERITACISSQVGCSLACAFCATGYMKRERNLFADEIFQQAYCLNNESKHYFGTPLSNVVLMGMGEPLLNYREVLRGIHYIHSEDGLHMSNRRITLSTAGITRMIKKLADDETKFNLALSLHAANDEKRNRIMPINEQNALVELKDALSYYLSKSGRKCTIEYIIFDAFNDEIEDAKELVQFCSGLNCKINIIEYNPIEFANFTNAKTDKIDAFIYYLKVKGLTVTYRRSGGRDVHAACGQLAISNKQKASI